MMSSQPSVSIEETAVSALYRQLLQSWNRRSADVFADLFTQDGHSIGYDGSEMHGREEIAATLGKIFADHPTAAYISKVREIRFLTPGIALLRAVVGMLPTGKQELNPERNTVHTMLATKQGDVWRILLFQNTPAQYHGKPDALAALTQELQELV